MLWQIVWNSSAWKVAPIPLTHLRLAPVLAKRGKEGGRGEDISDRILWYNLQYFSAILKFKSFKIQLFFIFHLAIETNWNCQKVISIHLENLGSICYNFFFFFWLAYFLQKIYYWNKGAATDTLGVFHNIWYMHLFKTLKYTKF